MNKLTKGILLILSVFAYSCEKKTDNQQTIVFGQVTDSKTGDPISDVSFFEVSGCDDLARQDTIFTSLKTGVDGKFELKANIHYGYCYQYLFAHYPGYNDSRLGASIGGINECNIKLIKNAYLKLHLKNTTPYNSSDQIYFDAGNGSESIGGAYIIYPGVYTISGASVDTTIIVNSIPNYTHRFFWSVTKNFISTHSDQYVYIPSGDTVNYSVLY